MKRSLIFTTLILILSGMILFVSAPAFADVNAVKGKNFINGIDKDYPPHAFIDEKGNPTGFDVDAMNWIADKMGFTVEHKPFEWKTIVQMLVEGKISMVCSGMSITPARAEQVNFSESYFTVRKVFMAPKDSDLNAEKIFTGKMKLGVQQGTNEAAKLEDMLKNEPDKYNYTLTQYATPSDAIADMLNGRVVAVAMDNGPAENAVRMGRPIKEVGTWGEIDDFGVAVNKKDTDLLEAINEGFKLLQADPYWEELQRKYEVSAK